MNQAQINAIRAIKAILNTWFYDDDRKALAALDEISAELRRRIGEAKP